MRIAAAALALPVALPLALTLALAPALAQDTPPPPPDAATPTVVPAPPNEPADLPDAAVLPGEATPVGADPTPATEGTLTLRGEDTMLAAKLGSIRVFSGDGESGEEIGDVEEIVLSHDGRIVALVVGVGGFLGLGEKPVGILYERLNVRETEEGIEFTTDLTRSELMDAPAYTPRQGD